MPAPLIGGSQTGSTAGVQACKMCVDCVQSILVAGKPHLGTDRLIKILQAFRKHLTALDVKIHFGTCATGLEVQHDKVVGVRLAGIMTTRNACQMKTPHCLLLLVYFAVAMFNMATCLADGLSQCIGHILCYSLLPLQHHALYLSVAKLFRDTSTLQTDNSCMTHIESLPHHAVWHPLVKQ